MANNQQLLLGEGAGSAPAVYIEDVFSTYLYTGNGSTQTITNGIDLSTKGGLVWIKDRVATNSPFLFDTARGALNRLASSAANNQVTVAGSLTNFNSNGFSLGSYVVTNTSANTYVSWTFRKQAKFFDIVTYTGDGTNRTIAHNLGSVPGCIIVKRTDTTADWQVYHRSLANTEYLVLNTTAATATGATRWNSTTPTSTVFSLGTDTTVNASGGTYVAYIYAHDAGGFGLNGTDNVISCGSYTGNGSATGPVVTLGYEPQWLMIKRATGGTGNWQIIDNMRGMPVGSADATLQANLTNAESSVDYVSPTATGFQVVSISSEVNTSTNTYIYIAIRRGPMKVPTSGTQVFSPVARTGTGVATTVASGFVTDLVISPDRGIGEDRLTVDRLRGGLPVYTNTTSAEGAVRVDSFDVMSGFNILGSLPNISGRSYVNYFFQRAPGFFDVVCYTGDGTTNRSISHNLGAVPELIIQKSRSSATNWPVYSASRGAASTGYINSTLQFLTGRDDWGPTTPTASSFYVTGGSTDSNSSGVTYIAYLFATVAGVSKVGSYTGTGTTQVINCGFTAGSRFVMIKRTNSTGDWYVWDSARGIVAGNDPYLLLNSTAAEVTSTDYIDTASTGFEISSTAPAAINANGGSFIFWAVA